MQILRFCGYTQKFSLHNLRRGVFWRGKSEQSAKFSPQKSYFHQFVKIFSLESLPLYGTMLSYSTAVVVVILLDISHITMSGTVLVSTQSGGHGDEILRIQEKVR